MKLRISEDVLSFDIDKNAELIEKIVASKSSTPTKDGKGSQGTLYVNKNYIGRLCVFVLIEPRFENDVPKFFDYKGETKEYYDLIVRDIKSIKTVKEYCTGRAYLPYEWIGKKVWGIILDN